MKVFLKNKIWILLILGLGVGAVLFVRRSAPVASSTLGKVVRGDVIQRVTIAGGVTPNRKTMISAPYNGYVRKIYVHVGDHVKAGDPIVALAQSLRGDDDASYPLRAPFAGTVVQVLKTEGEYVELQSSTGGTNAIVRIDDLSRLFVEASTPEIEIEKLKIGQEVIIKASAVLDRSYKGKIERISLAAKDQKDWDKSRVEFSVLIEVSEFDAELKPGMSVIVDIITNKLSGVLTLKHEFIQTSGGKYYVVSEVGAKKSIEVGLQNEESFEIKSGVVEGEKVQVTDFLSMLKDSGQNP